MRNRCENCGMFKGLLSHNCFTFNKRNLGNKSSEATKEKLRQIMIKRERCIECGKITANIHFCFPWNKGLKTGVKPWLGKKRLNISKENHYRWIKNREELIKNVEKHERNNKEYYHWRMLVWMRDSFKCKINNVDCNGKIQVHHILAWRSYPELRYELNNGITLCHAHHPLKRAEEKRLIPLFKELVSVSNAII